ncbi:MAG: protein phosphatase 2C domain-containing protein, partial [Azonexus sp.]|nr:protein phosphatase 2C domain-containing protein [Azonexus sp.]
MQIEIAVLSKPGGRERNEDACGYWTSEDACCWVLSDGLGGHGGGDIASKLVVSTILHGFAAKPLVDGVNVTKLLDQAN